MISRSRSTTSLRATLCTRPAESPRLIFFQRMGESSNPTRRSSTRRACWAFTRFMSTSRGLPMARMMASLVISWKAMRRVRALSRPRVSQRCQEMASPSRSSSEASHMTLALLASLVSSATTFFLPSGITYSGVNPPSISMLSCFSCRSLICPSLAFTVKPSPRNLWIVLALVGDSTITKLPSITFNFLQSKTQTR